MPIAHTCIYLAAKRAHSADRSEARSVGSSGTASHAVATTVVLANGETGTPFGYMYARERGLGMTTRRIRGALARGYLRGLHAATPRPATSVVSGAPGGAASRARPVHVALLAAAFLAGSLIPVVHGAEPGPQAVVQSFYAWYIAEAQAGGAVNLRGRPDLTPAFVDWTEHYNDGQMFGGADPVLCAQDIPESVTAGAAAISGIKATVPVTEAFGYPYRITVGLTLGSAGWQISTGGCAQASVAIRMPDGRIRLGTHGYPGKTTSYHATFVGNNIYNTTGAHQKATVEGFSELEGAFKTFDISIQNDGTRADRFNVKATGAATGGWTLTYFHGTTNITSAVVAGTFRTSSLAPGATYLIRARITKGSGNMTRLVTIRSVADVTKVDAVRFAYKEISCGC